MKIKKNRKPYLKKDAGNVEYNNAVFNNSTAYGSCETSSCSESFITEGSIEGFIYDGTKKVPKDVVSVVVKDGVEVIPRGCFESCEYLKSITIPNSVVKLEDGCFSECHSLNNVEIPDSVRYIGERCFSGCKSLKSVNISNVVTHLYDYCFFACYQLEFINIPESVEYICQSCFGLCTQLKSITIPSSVKYIGTWCFDSCLSLQSITIPKSVLKFGNKCFVDCDSLKILNTPKGSLAEKYFNKYYPDVDVEYTNDVVGESMKKGNKEAKIKRYSDVLSDEDRKNGWWYFTTHGVQPGSIPKDLNVLEIKDTANGTFVKLDGILNTSELKKYDMKEKAPKSMNEASYGGAYDIEDDMYFTKDDLMEFLDILIEKLDNQFKGKTTFDIQDAYFDSPTHVNIELVNEGDETAFYDFNIDMRKIRKPNDLQKYIKQAFDYFVDTFAFYGGYSNIKHLEDIDQYIDESLNEDTVKQNGKWVNKGKEGTHGKFRTKKAADAQRKAMFANGYKESLNESVEAPYFKAFITNLGKYNEGDLVGTWVEFPIDANEFNKILHDDVGIDEQYEEWFVTDYDCNLPSFNWQMLGEYASYDDLNDFGEKLSNVQDIEAVSNSLEIVDNLDEVLEGLENGEIIYYPGIHNEYDLGQYVIDEFYGQDIPEDLINDYFDFAALGRDLGFDDYETDEEDEDGNPIYVSAGEYWCGDENASDYEIGETFVDEVGIDGVANKENYFDYEAFGNTLTTENFHFTRDGVVEWY